VGCGVGWCGVGGVGRGGGVGVMVCMLTQLSGEGGGADGMLQPTKNRTIPPLLYQV
jgi:hypothetical protein